MEMLCVLAVLGVVAVATFPAVNKGLVVAKQTQCLSNMRQIGTALMSYASDHDGLLPQTTHSTAAMGVAGRYESWIYKLADYLEDVNAVRICPADKKARRNRIRETDGLTSYLLNDLVFDSAESSTPLNRLQNIPLPSKTMLIFPASDNLAISRGRDHIHGGSWTSWFGILGDIEPDRHRSGNRATDRLKGSANYVFADGHVATISATELKKISDAGVNPAAVPH